MKFENNLWLRHELCLDTFIEVQSVVMDTGNKAIVNAYWMIQGMDGYWYAADVRRYVIRPKLYHSWKPYMPTGELRIRK